MKPDVLETVPLVHADGTREYVHATPDVVTPPAVRGERKQTGFRDPFVWWGTAAAGPRTIYQAFADINAMKDRWLTVGYGFARIDWAEPFDGAAALAKGREIAGVK